MNILIMYELTEEVCPSIKVSSFVIHFRTPRHFLKTPYFSVQNSFVNAETISLHVMHEV